MKKHKINYKLQVFESRKEATIYARKEISYEIKLASKLFLDELCFNWNKARLETQINQSIDHRNKREFIYLSQQYQPYIKE